MKQFIILFWTGVLLVSCTNSTQKMVEKSVQNYLKRNLKNPKTYEPINFSNIDTIFQSDTLNNYLIELNDYLTIDSSSLLYEIEKDYYSSDDYKKTVIVVNNLIDSIKMVLMNQDTKQNIAGYKVNHNYKHLGLDNQTVDLNIEFTLDKAFIIIPQKIVKGINGQANFEIKIICKNRELTPSCIDYVIDPKFDGQLINSNGETKLSVKSGRHFLTWTNSNENDFYLSIKPETFRREIIIEDSEFTQTFFVIYGFNFFSYKTENEANNSEFYNEYLKLK